MKTIIVKNKLFEVERFGNMNGDYIAYRIGGGYTSLYNRKYIEATEENIKIMEEIKIKQNEILELEKLYKYNK